MATTADIKIGACIELEGKTFQIVDFQHVKPGKGPAFVRTKLKNLENGRVLEQHLLRRCEGGVRPRGAPSLPVHLRGRPRSALHAHRDLRGDQHRQGAHHQLRPDGRRPDRRGDVPHGEGDRPLGRTPSYRRHGGDLHRTRRQGRHGVDQLAQHPPRSTRAPRCACRCSSIPATRSASTPAPATTWSASSSERRSSRKKAAVPTIGTAAFFRHADSGREVGPIFDERLAQLPDIDLRYADARADALRRRGSGRLPQPHDRSLHAHRCRRDRIGRNDRPATSRFGKPGAIRQR